VEQHDPSATARPTWFRALARLWGLRTIEAAPRGSPVALIMLLSASWLAAWVLVDRWQRQPDPEFSADGIPLLAWYALAILCWAGLLSWRARPRPALGAALVLALGLTPLPLLLMSVVVYFLDGLWFWCAGGAVALYALAYLARGLRTLTGRPQRSAALLGVVFLAAFIYASDALNAIPDLWNPRDTDSQSSDEDAASREAALFDQADRIDEALEAVRRDAGAVNPEAFFLGFAGVGDEKVFAQEIGLASRVLGERYDIGDRRLSLINDERDLDRAPIASVSGLRFALRGLAARMDLGKDVLFLAISSHGSSSPAIEVSNSQIPLQNLSAPDLTDALHDAGIQWRVIIISACYAGGFIDSLRDPKTIVITAAAADRTSFGCSSDSDLTYFGEAFYRDALPGARSLRDAFETAKAAIAVREQGEHVTASVPQAFFGQDIEAKLKGWETPERRAPGKEAGQTRAQNATLLHRHAGIAEQSQRAENGVNRRGDHAHHLDGNPFRGAFGKQDSGHIDDHHAKRRAGDDGNQVVVFGRQRERDDLRLVAHFGQEERHDGERENSVGATRLHIVIHLVRDERPGGDCQKRDSEHPSQCLRADERAGPFADDTGNQVVDQRRHENAGDDRHGPAQPGG
jgi:hypothetical protein